MHAELKVLSDLVIVAGAALLITLLFKRLRLPATIGFIATGVVIGPGALGLVGEIETVRTLAEIGVVLLLFMVGLEFSVADLRALGSRPLVAGVLQLVLTIVAVAGALMATGAHAAPAIFFGFLVSLSSTALLLKLLTDRVELAAPHGRLTLGVLLVQDLALVPLTVLTPVLGRWASGGAEAGPGLASLLQALFVIVAAVLVIALAWRVAPWLLTRAYRTQSRETFLAATVFVVLGSAWLSSSAGLSLALGAFLAGLILADSDLRSQIAADVLPFRDTLASVFFVSIGMLLDPAVVVEHPGVALAATLGVVAVKIAGGLLATRLAGYTWTIAVPCAVALGHVGEFSFVLAQTGAASGLLSQEWEQAFLVAAVFSMVLAPWFVARGPGWGLRLSPALAHLPAPGPRLSGSEQGLAHPPARERHVVIAGFGVNGRNLARVLRAVRIPHVVLDVAPESISACAADGSEALLGNAAQPEILRHAGVPAARVLVLALSDPFATRHACRLAREMNPNLYILVRTRYVREMDGFYEAGANAVIPEEFETSIEIFSAVLRQFHVPPNIVEAQITLLRQERYSLMRGLRLPREVVDQLQDLLIEGTTETVLVLQHSPAVGHTLDELDIDGSHGCQVIAIVRSNQALTNYGPDLLLEAGDTLVLLGNHAAIDAAIARLTP